MPRVYKNKKKFIDPRYFLNEKMERTLKESPDWPEDKTQDAMMGRARGLAQQGMDNQLSGQTPPWEEGDKQGDGFTDASLEESDYDVLRWILKDLKTGTGRGNMASRFLSVMNKLGIALDDTGVGSESSELSDVDGDDMENVMGRFRDKLGR